jgi:hypothetical protein
MDPVMRALQSIADIDSETRELGQLEPASAFRTTRFEPTTTCATSGGTADLNRDLRALEIADVETNASEAAGAWDEIKIDRCDRIAIAPARDVTRHAVTLIGGALLLAFCVVWLAGSDWHFTVESALPPEKTVKSSADRPDSAKPGQPSASSADAIAAPIGSVHGTSKHGVQPAEPSLTKQAAKPPPRTAVGRTDLSKPTAVAETRPTTIAGWVIREVDGSTAVLEGPNAVWRASQGDTIPSIGKIDSIVRWGNRWIVATSKGLISTR